MENTDSGSGQRLQSSSSDTGDSRSNRNSGDAGRHTFTSTSSTDVSSPSLRDDNLIDQKKTKTDYLDQKVLASQQGRHAVDMFSSDCGTSTSITCEFLQIGNNNAIYLPRRGDDICKQRDSQFLDEFEAVSTLFVETTGYIEAKRKLNENKYVLITGCSGEGKSFIARKLVYEKIKEGFSVIPVDKINEWQERVKWREKQVVFLDDMLGRIHTDNRETEYKELITYIESVISEGMCSDKCSMFLVITCRRTFVPKLTQYMRCVNIFDESKIVDLSSSKLALTDSLRLEILKNHLRLYRPKHALEDIDLNGIVSSQCPVGFPNCVNLFTRNSNLFNRGAMFFRYPTEYVHQEILRVYENDTDIYALLLFLLVREGEIQISTLDRICNETLEFPLLQSIGNLPSRQIGTRFRSALKRIDETFVIEEGNNIRFSHTCVMEAVCLSFSNRLQHEAIKWLPFQFIVNRIRSYDLGSSVDEEHVKVKESIYRDLSERFVKEIEIGNIQSVVDHQNFTSPKFVLSFIEVLQQMSERDVKRLNCVLQITEQDSDRGALFNGSLLYWSASYGRINLCSLLLERKFYDDIADKFWVRTQASAALVPACWYGFDTDTLDNLLKLGACVNSSLHQERRSQTHFCDNCTVHDEDGMTTIQSTCAVDGENSRPVPTLQFLFDKGAKFSPTSVNRPLIDAVLKYNKLLDECKDCNVQPVLETIKILLAKGVDVNLKDSNDKTALIYCVANDNIDIVSIFLAHLKTLPCLPTQHILQYAKSVAMVSLLEENNIDKDFTQRDHYGRTLLHRANHEDLVQYFISKGCHLNQRDRDGRTPLFYAETKEILGTMLDNGASVVVQDYDDKNILHFFRNPELAIYVLNRCQKPDKYKLLSATDKWGRTPLFAVVSPEMVSVLICNGADVNYQAPEAAMTSESAFVAEKLDEQLGKAIYGHNNSIEWGAIVKSIEHSRSMENSKNIVCANFIKEHTEFFSAIQPSFDVNKPTLECISTYTQSFSKAEGSSSLAVLENSSENEPEITSESSEDEKHISMTIAMKLARSGKLTEVIVKELQNNNVNFCLTDVANNTVLHHLLTPDRKCKEITQILPVILESISPKSKTSFVNTKNAHGMTALHLACSCTELNRISPEKRRDIVDVLLKAGADVNVKNKSGETPLHCLFSCVCVGKAEVASLFKDVFNPNAIDKSEKSSLEKIFFLRSNSKTFAEDAARAMKTMYAENYLKDLFMDKIVELLAHGQINLLVKLLELCKQTFKEDEIESVRAYCISDNHKLNIRSWVVMLLVDSLLQDTHDSLVVELKVNERHDLLQWCIKQVSSVNLKKSIIRKLTNSEHTSDAYNNNGTSLFTTALMACKFQPHDMIFIVKHFLSIGANPNAIDLSGLCPFHYCILSGVDDEIAKECLLRFSKCKSTNFDIGLTLHLAVQINRIRTSTIRSLPNDISPNQKDAKGNAIHHLVIALSKYGRRTYVPTATFSALVERGVDINMFNEDGETPLHIAMKYNVHTDIIIEMLRNGADPNRKQRPKQPITDNDTLFLDEISNIDDDDQKSPFQYMFLYCQLSSVMIVREMLKYEADVIQKDASGRNTFHVITSSINRLSLKVILLLINHIKVDEVYSCLNSQDSKGNTPLHNLCTFVEWERDAWCISLRVAIARVLVAKGARLDIRNNEGHTPFHSIICQYEKYATQIPSIISGKFMHNSIALIVMFSANDANLDIRDNSDNSVRTTVDKEDMQEVKLLLQGEITPEELLSFIKTKGVKRN